MSSSLKTSSPSIGPNLEAKSCNKCGKEQTLDRFEKSKGYTSNVCRSCRDSGRRKKMSESPYSYISNLYNQLSNKRKKTHGFTITKEDLYRVYDKQKGLCRYSGLPMTYIKDGTGKHLTNISIDRIENKVGYHEGNIALVCLSCNMMKYNLELNDLIDWCKLIADNYR